MSISIRYFMLLAACFLTGFFSTPTPDTFSIIELTIAICLLGFFNPLQILNSILSISRHIQKGSIHGANLALFVFLTLILAFINGIFIRGNGLNDFIRDFIPLLYLFLPIFMFNAIQTYDSFSKIVLLKVLISGLFLIAAGYIFQFIQDDNFSFAKIGVQLILGSSRDNIMQDPSITFALIFSLATTAHFLKAKKFVLLISSALFHVIILACLFASVLRAPIGLYFLTLSYLLLKYTLENRRLAMALFIVLFITFLIVFFQDYLFLLFGLLVEKTLAVGLSGRDLETEIVLASIKNPYDLLLGFGLGSKLQDIFGYGYIRYTHNFFTYIIFKFGLIGLIAFSLIFIKCFKAAIYALVKYKIDDIRFFAVLSLTTPVIISTLFEPMYKSFSFGLLLTVLFLVGKIDDETSS
jgi:hypothetical protein